MIGYVLFLVASLMKAKFPNLVLVIADISVYILGVGLFSWLAWTGINLLLRKAEAAPASVSASS